MPVILQAIISSVDGAPASTMREPGRNRGKFQIMINGVIEGTSTSDGYWQYRRDRNILPKKFVLLGVCDQTEFIYDFKAAPATTPPLISSPTYVEEPPRKRGRPKKHNLPPLAPGQQRIKASDVETPMRPLTYYERSQIGVNFLNLREEEVGIADSLQFIIKNHGISYQQAYEICSPLM